ncbi:MAG: HAD family hydrolase [Oscillospiraceae bacterium]|nr:HAD family hydrolase [Oscillospiraceae bacterium]
MKYRCLVLDHDDTVVKSTPSVHYPSFVRIMKAIRPNDPIEPMERFMEFCSEPGYFRYCEDILHFTAEEHLIEKDMWHEDVKNTIPDLYEGFFELLHEFKNAGGIICVVTHSVSRVVCRDYEAHDLPAPDAIFGADLPEEQQKPNPWPIEEICRRFNLQKGDLLMVDDLMTGLSMAQKCGIASAAAGWSHISPKIRERVRSSCTTYCESVDDLKNLVF